MNYAFSKILILVTAITFAAEGIFIWRHFGVWDKEVKGFPENPKVTEESIEEETVPERETEEITREREAK